LMKIKGRVRVSPPSQGKTGSREIATEEARGVRIPAKGSSVRREIGGETGGTPSPEARERGGREASEHRKRDKFPVCEAQRRGRHSSSFRPWEKKTEREGGEVSTDPGEHILCPKRHVFVHAAEGGLDL